MQAIRDYFEAITPLSDDEWNAFSSKLSRQEFSQEIAHTERRENRRLSFVH
jgi:hypothetical protein